MVTPRVSAPSGIAEFQETPSTAVVGEVLIVRLEMLFFLGAPDVSPVAFLFCLLATVYDPDIIKSETFITT